MSAVSTCEDYYPKSPEPREPPRPTHPVKDFQKTWSLLHHSLAHHQQGSPRCTAEKGKTHALSDKMVQQRLLKGLRLLKHLTGRKLTNIVSTHEVWSYMSHVNGRRRVFYHFPGNQSLRSFLKYWREKKPRGIMFVAGISWRGRTAIRFVPRASM